MAMAKVPEPAFEESHVEPVVMVKRKLGLARGVKVEEDPEAGNVTSWTTNDHVSIAAAAAAAAVSFVPDPIADDAVANTINEDTKPPALPTGSMKKPAAKKKSTFTIAKAETVDESIRNDISKKAQVTYNPEISMTKEQLTTWRREQRRVRNRESAAASRRKVRDRIGELEDEVDIWKRRYQEVMARLGQSDVERVQEELQVRKEVEGDEEEAVTQHHV